MLTSIQSVRIKTGHTTVLVVKSGHTSFMGVCFFIYSIITPLTKLGELGSELVCYCILKSKTGVQVKDKIEICYFHKGSTKQVQIMSTKTYK